MGPRSDERGNEELEDSSDRRARPSMGPRSDERGNVDGRNALSAEDALQWGRAQMSAEMRSSLFLRSLEPLPSMGPRSDERGNHPMRWTR